MEINNINESVKVPSEKYEAIIIKIVNDLKKYEDIKIQGKILFYSKQPIFYYICTILGKSNSNPFNKNITFGFEFINKEKPYITILTDFIEPTLNDNRNYYHCLSKDYFFSLYDLKQHEIILEDIIKNIGKFLFHIKESTSINAFIFFGEYEFGHIYQINDFLQNNQILKFYRIYNKMKKENYIIFTKLYFLLFEPLQHDKALVKLVACRKLKDVDFFAEKDEKGKNFLLKFGKKDKTVLAFEFIDRSLKDANDNNNENNNNEKEYINLDKLRKDLSIYQNNINYEKYIIILNDYKILFNETKGNLDFKNKKLNENQISEYNKYIEYNEKLLEYYKNLNNKDNNKRVEEIISNVTSICSDMVGYSKYDKEIDNEYVLKIRKIYKNYK